ncbi:hypothetical protein MPSEU_000776100 [Mayamaea pseudoterrestris]|nr:hypothetical protein MPSEU_000776100 [Mayamaea pseudoterrestris]
MASISRFAEKAFSASYYKTQWQNILTRSYDYYHPLFRQGSATPLWHMMMAVSAIMYTTSYLSRDLRAMQHKHEVEKKVLHDYYEQHGGAPHH